MQTIASKILKKTQGNTERAMRLSKRLAAFYAVMKNGLSDEAEKITYVFSDDSQLIAEWVKNEQI